MRDIILRFSGKDHLNSVSHVSGPSFQKVTSETHSWCEISNINTANCFKMYYYAKLGKWCIHCYLPSHFYHLVAERIEQVSGQTLLKCASTTYQKLKKNTHSLSNVIYVVDKVLSPFVAWIKDCGLKMISGEQVMAKRWFKKKKKNL